MTDAGFRYFFVDWAAIDAAIDAATPSLSETEVLTTQGYGFAASLLGPTQVIPDPEGADLNVDLYETFSPEEQVAWDAQRDVCWDHAAGEIPDPELIYSNISDDLAVLYQQINSDGRIVAAVTAWSGCMADQGFQYPHRDAIGKYLNSLQAPLLERVLAAGGPDNIGPALRAEIDSLAAHELEIARADVSCKKDLDTVVYNVTVEYQQQFIDGNEDRLALLRDEAASLTYKPVDD